MLFFMFMPLFIEACQLDAILDIESTEKRVQMSQLNDFTEKNVDYS